MKNRWSEFLARNSEVIAWPLLFLFLVPFGLAMKFEILSPEVRIVLGFVAIIAIISFPIWALLIWIRLRKKRS